MPQLALPVKGESGAEVGHFVDASSPIAQLLTPPLTRPPSPSTAGARPAEQPYAAPTTSHLNPIDFPRHQLTPAIGLRFEPGLQIKDVLNLPEDDGKRAEILKELAYTSERLRLRLARVDS